VQVKHSVYLNHLYTRWSRSTEQICFTE